MNSLSNGSMEGNPVYSKNKLAVVVAILSVLFWVSCAGGGGGGITPPPPANNPVPSITGITPAAVPPFGPDFTLAVNGGNFISSSTVMVNGSARTTTFVNSTQLTTIITVTDRNLASGTAT